MDSEAIDLIENISSSIKKLREKNIIRTNNLLGDLGEFQAVEYYNNRSDLPNLTLMANSNKHFDAESESKERYSIKTTTGNGTGVIYGLEPKDSDKESKDIFDFLIVVKMNNDFTINTICEIPWHVFLEHKKWHKTMGAWNIQLTKKVIESSRVLS
jgi:hypothetical protein